MSSRKAPPSSKVACTLLLIGATSTIPIAMAPRAVFAAVTGGIQGIVRDSDGKPVAGAHVSLIGTGTPQVARTDGSGYYTFTGVQPGAYTLKVEGDNLKTQTLPVTATQDITQNVDFALETSVIGTGHSKVRVGAAPTRRTDTNTGSTTTARDEQREKSQPNNLYQSTGLLNYKPGVTVDPGQYPHLRGSDLNQIDYLMDGISIRDPIFNEFATNLVTVGVQRSNVQTAGQDASYGGATGGYLNQLTVNGRDLHGGFIENTNGPGSKWKYTGSNFQYGNLTPDNKFDYAISSILFKTKYGDNTQLGSLNSSQDNSVKLNYYAGQNDTFTLYGTHGEENYFTYQPGDPTQQTLKFDFRQTLQGPNGPVATALDTGKFQQDTQLQRHDMTYGLIKHNFTPSSNIQYRLYKLHQSSPVHVENTGAAFLSLRTQMVGNQVDYFNQITRGYQLRAGFAYIDKGGSSERSVAGITSPVDQTPSKRYTDRLYGAQPRETDLYVANKFTTPDNKITADLGVRFGNTRYDLKQSSKNGTAITSGGQTLYTIDIPKAYSSKFVDPRVGLNYSPNRDLVFRTSYSVNSQQPETRFIEFLSPIEYGGAATALNSDTQFLANHRNRNALNRLQAYHSKDFDLGVEKAFTMGGPLKGAYTVTLTGYRKNQYDLIQEDQASFDTANFNPGPAAYGNGGHGHSSGVEFQMIKRPDRPSSWNGFVSYTNQVVRANASFVDTGYTPYFSAYLGGLSNFYDSRTGNPNGVPVGNDLRRLNQIEFPTSYDQRHTVAVVAGKRISKLIETTFILDAGSGFPFFSGGTSGDGSFGTVDAQHGELGTSLGGNADFGEVPFVTPGGNRLVPVSPVAGRTGWHYKIGINTSFTLTPTTSLFLNVDNVFDRKTPTTLAPATFSGVPYFEKPTAAFPQGKIIYGPSTILTPIFLTFGFRQRF